MIETREHWFLKICAHRLGCCIGRIGSVAALTLANILLVASCAIDSGPSRHVEVSVISYDDPQQLASKGDYLIRGTVLDSPAHFTINGTLARMHNTVRVDKVLQHRQGASPYLDSGKTIRVGMSVLDPEEPGTIVNYDELAAHLPTPDEALAKGEEVLLFLVSATGSDNDLPTFGILGYGTVGANDKVAWKGFSGALAGTTSDLTTATHPDVLAKFDEARPLDEAVPVQIPEVPPDGRPPMTLSIVDS